MERTKYSIIFIIILLYIFHVDAKDHANCSVYDPEKTLPCQEIFDRFHKCEGKFIETALNTSNPFTMCSNTLSYYSYTKMTIYFSLLLNTTDKKNQNQICSDEFLNKNQMTVITSIVATSKNLWESAHCDDCYNVISSDSQTFANHTLEIKELHEKYAECTNSQINTTSICNSCEEQYLAMNTKFETEKRKRYGAICFDLEDIMNKTRQEWSGTFKCCKDKRDSMTGFYAVFSSVITITVLFYITIYVSGSKYQEVDHLDAHQASISIPQPSVASSSSNPTSTRRNRKQKERKSLIINDESDDELLIKPSPVTSTNNTNLVQLDD